MKLTLFLVLSLCLPSPALALRAVSIGEQGTGLEELQAALNPLAGLQDNPGQMTRRRFLQLAKRGLVAAALSPLACGLTPEQIKQSGPVGALTPLRKRLGPEGRIGIDVGDPWDLLELNDFFALAVKTGVDTVWISEERFRRLSYLDRQKILTLASRAGLRTLGFTDEVYREPKGLVDLVNHYSQLTTDLYTTDLDGLQVAFATRVESEVGVWGVLRQTRRFAEEKLRPNGESVAARVLFLRRDPSRGEGVEDWRYGSEVEPIVMMDGQGSEKIPKAAFFHLGIKAQDFQGKEEEIGPAWMEAVDSLPLEDRNRVRGLTIDLGFPLAAHRFLMRMLPAQPAREFGIKEGRASRFGPWEITLDLDLPRDMIDEPWVAIPFVKKSGEWTPQPFPDRRAAHPIRANGRVTVRTAITHPFQGDVTQGRIVVFLPQSQFDQALKAYLNRDVFAAIGLSFKIVVIGDNGSARAVGIAEIIQELASSGLEEWDIPVKESPDQRLLLIAA